MDGIQPRLQHVNAVGQGLIQSAAKHTDTQALEHDLENTNLQWNSLNKRVREFGRNLTRGSFLSARWSVSPGAASYTMILLAVTPALHSSQSAEPQFFFFPHPSAQVAERIAQLQEALLHCGKFQDALEPLLSWLSDTEELVANQKPPSAEYRVVKAQIQEQKVSG